MNVHGTCVACALGGVLLRGPSGAGKSDLALRLIAGGTAGQQLGLPDQLPWQLVADDRVLLQPSADGLMASCPPAIVGQLEVRGIGVIALPARAGAPLRLVVDLVPLPDVPRFPAIVDGAATTEIAGYVLPRLALFAFEASAPIKVALALAMQAPAKWSSPVFG